MRPLSLDFQRARVSSTKTGLLLLLIGLAAAGAVGYKFRVVDVELTGAEERTGHLERLVQRHGAPKQSKATPELKYEVQQANEVLHQLSMPWEGLFKTLETSDNDRVALLAIQPDVRKRIVKLNGEAKDFTALLDYLKQLEQDKALTDIVLLNHEIHEQDPERPVRFAVSAAWRLQP